MNKQLYYLFGQHSGVILLVLAALAVRIILVASINQNRIAPDGIGYHTIAVNLANGNGYTIATSEPFEKHFLREPGYPIFIAGVYKLYSLFGGEIDYINNFDRLDLSYAEHHPEIYLVKYFQAIIDTFTVLLFYFCLLQIFQRRYALIIAFVWALYLPLMIHVTHVLRETILAFFAMVIVYSFLRYLASNKIIWLIILSLFWAFSALTFQFSIILGPFLFFFLFFNTKNIYSSIKLAAISGIIFLFVSSPWLIRTYKFYPDIRILTSFGTSLTSEYRSLINATFAARDLGVFNQNDIEKTLHKGYLGASEAEKFRMSFEGELKAQTDSINQLVNEPRISKRKIKNTVRSFVMTWVSRIPTSDILDYFDNEIFTVFGFKIYGWWHFVINILLAFFSLLGIPGMILFWKKTQPLLLIFMTYIPFFFVLGTESRRMLPAQSYMIMFSVLTVLFSLYYIKHKGNPKSFLQNISRETA